ncbi:MAG: fibronectin type III domain-containing protein [Actinomycetales bacterium]|nr:fibronectin type III domain-containing protein [Actinomycetales bacterium]
MKLRALSRRTRIAALATSLVTMVALLVAVPAFTSAAPTVVRQTFGYTGSTATFTVPDGVSALTITVVGAEGGNGGADATPAPPPGGYRGVVTGTITVTPGQNLTVAVGSGGATGASRTNSGGSARATGGNNPLAGYDGGLGGAAGANGSSGFGGAGGAASVVMVGSTPIVAAGGGGNGGSGQFSSTRGRTATATYLGRTDSTSTSGQAGINANDACVQTSCSNNDGGGSGGGGGGAQGGAQGAIEFGAGSSNEWYGFGGSVGQNSTATFSGLSASYQYYSDNGAAGSVEISYVTGPPSAPSAVSGTVGDGSVDLIWSAPASSGQSVITDYVVRYSSDGGTSWSSPVSMGSTETSGTVSGLTNGTAYIFQVAAVNSVGTGDYSASSPSVTPLGPPSAPSISAVTAQDAALQLSLVAPSSGAPATGYDYRVDGGSWVGVASSATSLVIPGLLNGTAYTVEVRAQSIVGPGAVSEPATGTPRAVPGAPTISSLAVGPGALTLSFTTGFSGGDAITAYQYRLNSGSWVTASGTSSPIEITGLDDGTSYAVELRAVNSSGPGAASSPASATTPAAPDAPVVSSVVAGDRSATVTFAPGATGGTPILGYQYQLSDGGPWVDLATSSSPLVLTGLTNGTDYAVSLRARNAVGTGAASAPVAVTPATVPGAPAIGGDTIAGSDATLSVDFTAPSEDGGAPITGYEYSTDGGATWLARTDGGDTASPLVITALSSDGSSPLTNGETYLVELRAVNAAGAGTASAVASGIATAAPDAPSVTAVSASDRALTVSFTAASNGGSVITEYQYSLDDGDTWTTTGTLRTSFVIDGLSNGTAYPVRVRAVNAIGDGAASAAVTGTPVGLPGRASIGGVVRSNQTLTATVALADDGGSPITAWEYSTDAGATWATAPGTTSPLTLTVLSSDTGTRLANGTGYAVQVRAVTAVGTGPASATTIVAPASAPAAPSIAATAGDSSVTIAFSLGTDGGSPVTGLEYSLDGGASWVATGTLSSPFTIGGLSNGTAYSVSLRAVNAIGEGAASVPASTTPRTRPGAPSEVVATSNTASADVSWSAPAFDGGAPITGYTVSAYASAAATSAVATCTTTGATSCALTGLTNGTTYYVSVVATNAAGSGPASAPRVPVVPLARPAAPTLGALTMGDGSISAPFTAGGAGDRAITGYQYSVDGGTTWSPAAGSSSPVLITGLTNGVTYTVALRAVSDAGVGATSNTRQGTPFTYPAAPEVSSIVANGGDARVTVSWAAADMKGGTLQNYTATAFTGATSGSTAATCTTTGLSCVITGLTNGTTYYISLQTQNTSGMYSVRSAPRVAVTPSRTPGAPTGVTGVAGDGTVTVTWAAPMSTGASAITGYTVYCSVGGGAYSSCGTSATTSLTLGSATNGSTYAFKVAATNGNGTGPQSTASSAVTPLAPGVAPVLAAPVSTDTGFTTAITNYDASVTYTGTATAGATVAISGATVTVSGLSDGAGARLTVQAVTSTTTPASASVDGTALLAGIAPTFSGNVATATGFEFRITNYDADASYTLTADHGATVTRSGADVTVNGVPVGGSAAVTVAVVKAGSATASAVNAGAALVAGTAPTFTALTATPDGFTVQIANYDAGLEYALGVTGGATAAMSGATVTVSGLAPAASADLTVTATDPGTSVASAVQTGSALRAGTAATISAVTSTDDGFSFTITNPDLTASYTITSNAGTVAVDGATVTVTGLPAGGASDVTIVVRKSGYATVQTVVSAHALRTGITPLFAAPESTIGGFTFAISNFDASGSYTLASTAGTARLSGSTVVIEGLAAEESATVTVTVAHTGYTAASAAQTGAALAVGPAPVLSDVVPTADGFTFTIDNYDPALSYRTTLDPTGAVVVIAPDGTGTVSGAAPGALVTLTVAAIDPGISGGSATASATVLLPTTAPVLSASTPLAGGYRFTIVNYDAGETYRLAQADGGSASRSGDTVTVSGLAAAITSETTVTAGGAGHVAVAATASGTSFPAGATPTVSALTRTDDGFVFELTLEPGVTYTVASDAGAVTRVGSTVTVTGLAAGQAATVRITASSSGHLDGVLGVASAAISAGVAPTFGAPVSVSGGFVVTITNYSASVGYAVSTTRGTVTRDGARITVTGLPAGASAAVSVTTSRGGFQDATGSVTGFAATVPAPARPSSVTTPPEPAVVSGPTEPGAGAGGRSTGPGASALAELRASGAGAGSLVAGGATLTSRVSGSDHSMTVTGTGTGLALTVSAQDAGVPRAVGADGVVEVDRSGNLRVRVTGLEPDTVVTIWSMSGSVLLATVRADGDGALDESVLLPETVTAGVQTIVVAGSEAGGDPATLQVGIRVLDVDVASAVSPAAGLTIGVIVLIALLLLLALVWFLLLLRRRRRDKEDEEWAALAQNPLRASSPIEFEELLR